MRNELNKLITLFSIVKIMENLQTQILFTPLKFKHLKKLLDFCLLNCCMYIYIFVYMANHFTFYGSIPFTFRLIWRDGGGSSTLYHSCGFVCQKRILKTFPGPGYLRSEDEVA